MELWINTVKYKQAEKKKENQPQRDLQIKVCGEAGARSGALWIHAL